jgi:hypothetical protein
VRPWTIIYRVEVALCTSWVWHACLKACNIVLRSVYIYTQHQIFLKYWLLQPCYHPSFSYPCKYSFVYSPTVKMEAANASEILATFYQATWCHTPECCGLHILISKASSHKNMSFFYKFIIEINNFCYWNRIFVNAITCALSEGS